MPAPTMTVWARSRKTRGPESRRPERALGRLYRRSLRRQASRCGFSNATGRSRRPRSAQVDNDRFELGEAIHREAAADAADAAARTGPATERQVRFPIIGAVVDVDPARPNRLGEPQAAPQV